MLKLIIPPLLIFVAGCVKNTPLQTEACAPCVPIYGRAADWDVISDDLARNIYRHNRMCEEFKG